MHNIKLVIAYDGTRYLGWQKTRMGPSIEETLQKVVEKITQESISLQAASRTDAGVHAEGQIVNFHTLKHQRELNQFQSSLNSLLPKDIIVLEVKEMPLSFHPTLDSTGKEYRYFIDFGPTQLPHHRHYSWHVHYPLDIEAIRSSFIHLVGSHNFRSFCNVKKNAHYTDYVREIQSIEMQMISDHRLSFHIRGNHFLYKMARNMIGTLISIGRGKLSSTQLPDILQCQYRPKAGVTAPAHGLFLYKVFY
ncbi:MAG: tRNA pseudouridine(38-40) synthase TruA [Parachlamydiaceae bacterium]